MRRLEDIKRIWENNIKMDLKKWCGNMLPEFIWLKTGTAGVLL
jgi:hypothetical protein